ncbi:MULTISPECIES: L,D-transpeptidase [Thiorhodovibrio]|uniref:L,D-transpeptidase n=1 Tax=Thiorhodovibrio TaxID=61593 RepID=UPI001911C182|nr:MULTISPECIES: L,D-transpeptidase [Thiorhodovibrio]MBK5970064.1 hypothetical protein [Thiorhodovibrio winogradskyi]WPL12990.1 putative L,D-transpeptidase YnhG precursor [Thiorhodovibrio litoralis]
MMFRVPKRGLWLPVIAAAYLAPSHPALAEPHSVVHIDDHPQEAAAWSAWRSLQKHYSQAVSGLQPQVVERDWVYTLIGLPGDGDAQGGCQRLREAGHQCFVTQANFTGAPDSSAARPNPEPIASTTDQGDTPPPSRPQSQQQSQPQRQPQSPSQIRPPTGDRPGIQLALYHQRNIAEQGWQSLLARFPDLLTDALPVYRSLHGYIALQAVAGNAAERDALCASLRQRGAECLPATVPLPEGLSAWPDADDPAADEIAPNNAPNPDSTAAANSATAADTPPESPQSGLENAPPEGERPAAQAPPTPPKPPPHFGQGGPTFDYAASPLGPDSILISVSDRKLLYQARDGTVYVWPVAVGRHWSYHVFGETEITQKRSHPTWTPPPEMRKRNPKLPRSMGPGPHNPLGAYALNLGFPYIRIHGTNKPHSVGHAASSGCYRMHADAIKFLFQSVSVGTQVRVTPDPLAAHMQMTAAE